MPAGNLPNLDLVYHSNCNSGRSYGPESPAVIGTVVGKITLKKDGKQKEERHVLVRLKKKRYQKKTARACIALNNQRPKIKSSCKESVTCGRISHKTSRKHA